MSIKTGSEVVQEARLLARRMAKEMGGDTHDANVVCLLRMEYEALRQEHLRLQAKYRELLDECFVTVGRSDRASDLSETLQEDPFLSEARN